MWGHAGPPGPPSAVTRFHEACSWPVGTTSCSQSGWAPSSCGLAHAFCASPVPCPFSSAASPQKRNASVCLRTPGSVPSGHWGAGWRDGSRGFHMLVSAGCALELLPVPRGEQAGGHPGEGAKRCHGKRPHSAPRAVLTLQMSSCCYHLKSSCTGEAPCFKGSDGRVQGQWCQARRRGGPTAGPAHSPLPPISAPRSAQGCFPSPHLAAPLPCLCFRGGRRVLNSRPRHPPPPPATPPKSQSRHLPMSNLAALAFAVGDKKI